MAEHIFNSKAHAITQLRKSGCIVKNHLGNLVLLKSCELNNGPATSGINKDAISYLDHSNYNAKLYHETRDGWIINPEMINE